MEDLMMKNREGEGSQIIQDFLETFKSITNDSPSSNTDLKKSNEIWVYIGNWSKDQRTGRGIWMSSSGLIFDGFWTNDSINGKGILRFPVGDVLLAQFQNNKFIFGDWKILFRNGEYYEGGINKEMLRNGTGIHYYANGDIYKGDWSNNKRIGKGRLIFKDGSEYIGQFIDDQVDGHGLYTDSKGNRFESLVDETKK